MWDEVEQHVHKGRVAPFKLQGNKLEKYLTESEGKVPDEVFTELGHQVSSLELSQCASLISLPASIARLSRMQEAVITGTALESLPDELGDCLQVKTLILERNALCQIPACLHNLSRLQTLNVSHNKIECLPPSLFRLPELTYLNANNNNITALDESLEHAEKLSTLLLGHNQLQHLPAELGRLKSLHELNMAHNSLLDVPEALASCLKLKSLNLEGNPFTDKKLVKLIQDGPKLKPLLAYIKKSGVKNTAPRESPPAAPPPGPQFPFLLRDESDDIVEVYIHPGTKDVRPHLICAVIRNLEFNEASLRRFFELQNEIHQGLCGKRRLAALGTHDLAHIILPLHYDSLPPDQIHLTRLVRDKDSASMGRGPTTAGQLPEVFAEDPTMLKYLAYLQSLDVYAFLRDGNGAVLSLPPVINAEVSKVSTSTKDVLIEVSSTESLDICQVTCLTFLEEVVKLMGKGEGGHGRAVWVTPVRLCSPNGHVRLVFPRATSTTVKDT